jgi:lipopolysaccharide assembly outer membrane protein LptD (OstA)
MGKKLVVFLFVINAFFLCPEIKSSIDPLSKIVITSKSAIIKKDQYYPDNYTLTYYDDVWVTFADQSKVSSNELEIVLDTTKIKKNLDSDPLQTNTTDHTIPNQNNDLNQFKKITFKNKVHIQNTNRTIDANTAELYLSEKICKLFGNIKIKQNKEQPKDLPILTECEKAILNIETEEITFLGDSQKPVSTTIEIIGQPNVLKQTKTKKRKKTQKRSLSTMPQKAS